MVGAKAIENHGDEWKPPRTNTLADGLMKRTSSMLDEIEWKIVHVDEEGGLRNWGTELKRKKMNWGKRSKTMSGVKPVENISKNLQFFINKSCAKGSPSFT